MYSGQVDERVTSPWPLGPEEPPDRRDAHAMMGADLAELQHAAVHELADLGTRHAQQYGSLCLERSLRNCRATLT